MPLDRLAGRLGRPARIKRPDAGQQSEIVAAVDDLLERLPRPWKKTCLTRSAVLYHLLRRSNVPVELQIGVKRDRDGFAAHAWITREGRPYLESTVPAYEVIATFPPIHGHG